MPVVQAHQDIRAAVAVPVNAVQSTAEAQGNNADLIIPAPQKVKNCRRKPNASMTVGGT